jgi:hypothetical protein
MSSESLVSCLCVTERRPAFMPWLLWNFDKQTYAAKELIIVDSSPEPFEIERSDVRVVRAAPGTNVPAKRNLALGACRGQIVAWFDDDDWQHPDRLGKLASALDERHDYAGSSHSWFLDLYGGNCSQYFGHGALIFNGAGFNGDLARSVRFNEGVRKASDTVWLRELSARRPRLALLEDRLTLWLCHDQNISNARSRRRFPTALEQLKHALGAAAWGDTDTRLEALRNALPPPLERSALLRPSLDGDDEDDLVGIETSTRRTRSLGGRSRLQRAELASERRLVEPLRVDTSAARPRLAQAPARAETASLEFEVEKPEVSLVLLLEPRHAPYLSELSTHLFQQSNYGFVEKLLAVEVPPGAAVPEEAPGFDRVFDASPGLEDAAILERYFTAPLLAGALAAAPSPALRELFAIDRAASDLVLFCRSGVLFHASGSSWVREAVQRLKADSTLWAMTTHPGPPAGPVGHPRSWPLGVAPATWDRRLRIWRSREATSSYSLLDRKKLVRSLSSLEASLVDSMSAVLAHHGAFHGSVATKGSWALDATRAALPSADWLPVVASLVADGTVPTRQVGQFEISLSEPSVGEAWGHLIARARGSRAA